MPSIMISPVVGMSSPAIKPNSVDFPLPDGPMTDRNWPEGTDRSSG